MEFTLSYLRVFFQALHDPEYTFLFLEPMLLYGVAFGLLAFWFGLSIREPKTQMFGLICITGACLTVAPYLNQRKQAEERIVQVFSLSHPDRAYGFSYNNEDRTEKQWLYYATACMATLSMLFGQGESRGKFVLAAFTTLFCGLTILYGSLAHYEESKVYHPNLRRDLHPAQESPASLAQPSPGG